eukprot:GHVN01006201.1.p2 GENE.GHVN01006201.1~~GHVN01006201.1.p2  ORF type:complete len:113 (-),score=17.04 GHVN01006201.1:755-1093(-)
MALAVAGLGLRSYFVLMRSTDQQTADHVMIPVRQIAESSNSAKDLTNDAVGFQREAQAISQTLLASLTSSVWLVTYISLTSRTSQVTLHLTHIRLVVRHRPKMTHLLTLKVT